MLSDLTLLAQASLRPKTVFRLFPFLIFLFALAGSNIFHLIKLNLPNPKWQTVKTIAQTVRANPANIVFGSWEPEFSYLSLFLPEKSLICLPDLILEKQRDSIAVQNQIDNGIKGCRSRGGTVYFVNIFNQSEDELKRFYACRLRSPWFLLWIENHRGSVKPVWRDEKSAVSVYSVK